MIDPYRMIVINLIISSALILGLLFYRYIFPKKRINLLLLLVIISFLPLISILRKGGYESGDLSSHVQFAMQFYENLLQGNFLPRWIDQHCSGYGCPVYIFIFLASNYLISILHFIGFSFIAAAKIIIAASFILSGVGMYLWIKDEFGEKPGFTAAIIYLFAPYHLIDLHFRVSIGELISMAILPFLFLTTKKLQETKKLSYFIFTSLFFGLLILSHQVTSFASFPLILLYAYAVWFRKRKNKRTIRTALQVLFPYLCGVLLTAFYWLPIFTESKYTTYSLQNEITFHHFSDFLYSPTLFGLLFQGHKGELYTSIGYTQLVIVAFGLCLLLKRKVAGKEKILLTGSLLTFIILFTMMQSFTKPIWDTIPVIKNFQFSWRLMIESIFAISIISAIVVKKYPGKIFFITLCFISIFYTFLNWGNRKAVPEINDSTLRKQEIWKDYPGQVDVLTPKWVDIYKPWIGKKPKKHIEIINGNAEITEISRKIEKHEYVVQAKTKTVIKENTYYFPGWKLLIDNKETKINFTDKQYPGLITFNLDKGLHKVDIILTDTTDRIISKWISAVTATILGVVILFRLIRRFLPKR